MAQIYLGNRDDLLHALPPPARPYEEQGVVGMDRRAPFWALDATASGHYRRQEQIKMGPKKTIHGRRRHHRGFCATYAGMDI